MPVGLFTVSDNFHHSFIIQPLVLIPQVRMLDNRLSFQHTASYIRADIPNLHYLYFGPREMYKTTILFICNNCDWVLVTVPDSVQCFTICVFMSQMHYFQ